MNMSGINIGVDSDELHRVEKILAGISGGAEKAVKNSMTRAAQTLRSNTAKRIREQYDISTSNLRTEQNVKIRYSYHDGISVSVNYCGVKIPLYRYNGSRPKAPTVNQQSIYIALINGFNRRVHPGIAASGHQFRDTAVPQFENAFVAKMKSGHIGIFERTGGKTSNGSDEIKEMQGSSIPQMLGNDEVANALTKDAYEKFDERLHHETLRLLNGWGG